MLVIKERKKLTMMFQNARDNPRTYKVVLLQDGIFSCSICVSRSTVLVIDSILELFMQIAFFSHIPHSIPT